MNIGNNVRFIYSTKTVHGKEVQNIQKGKIIEYAKSGGYLIEIIDDRNQHTMNGTICNRGEADIIEVL